MTQRGLFDVVEGAVDALVDAVFGSPAPARPASARTRRAVVSRAGAVLRAHGRAKAAGAHADAVRAGWIRDASRWVLLYADGCQGGPFLLEDARAFAHARGLDKAPDARAWGAVVLALKAAGRLVKCGHGVDQFGSTKAQWRRA
jgi:hypothetical protein